MFPRHRCQSSSFGDLQAAIADNKFALLQPTFQTWQIEFNIVCNGVPRREILGLDLRTTARAVKFYDANPVRIGRKVEVSGNDGRVNLSRIAIVKQTAFF